MKNSGIKKHHCSVRNQKKIKNFFAFEEDLETEKYEGQPIYDEKEEDLLREENAEMDKSSKEQHRSNHWLC